MKYVTLLMQKKRKHQHRCQCRKRLLERTVRWTYINNMIFKKWIFMNICSACSYCSYKKIVTKRIRIGVFSENWFLKRKTETERKLSETGSKKWQFWVKKCLQFPILRVFSDFFCQFPILFFIFGNYCKHLFYAGLRRFMSYFFCIKVGFFRVSDFPGTYIYF